MLGIRIRSRTGTAASSTVAGTLAPSRPGIIFRALSRIVADGRRQWAAIVGDELAEWGYTPIYLMHRTTTTCEADAQRFDSEADALHALVGELGFMLEMARTALPQHAPHDFSPRVRRIGPK